MFAGMEFQSLDIKKKVNWFDFFNLDAKRHLVFANRLLHQKYAFGMRIDYKSRGSGLIPTQVRKI